MSEAEMVPHVLRLGDGAMEWMEEAWRAGLSLARMVSTRLESVEWKVFAVTGEANEKRLRAQNFRYGGLPATNSFRGLAAELSRRFEGDYLVVELALARPGDPVQLPTGAETVSCDHEVYKVIRIGSDVSVLEMALRLTDPASIFNAFVVTGSSGISSCPSALFKQELISVRAAMTGAYDGEGFIFAIR
jgi:hypothetical protein